MLSGWGWDILRNQDIFKLTNFKVKTNPKLGNKEQVITYIYYLKEKVWYLLYYNKNAS